MNDSAKILEKVLSSEIERIFDPMFKEHSIDDCAQILADYIFSLDPTWANRLQVMKDERGFTTLQAISTCIAHVLERGEHMMVIKHEALEPNPWRRGEKMECPECHVLYTPRYPGEPYCSNEHAESYRKRTAANLM
jgi:hypothetical protein